MGCISLYEGELLCSDYKISPSNVFFFSNMPLLILFQQICQAAFSSCEHQCVFEFRIQARQVWTEECRVDFILLLDDKLRRGCPGLPRQSRITL